MGARVVRGGRRSQPGAHALVSPDVDPTGRIHEPVPPPGPGAPYDVVLLDRDGTLNALAPGYRTVDDVEMLPGAARAAAALTDAGCRLVVVTNQRGIARGLLTWPQLAEVNDLVMQAVRDAGGVVDDIRLCPHDVGECGCRKPLPGLLEAFFADNPAVPRDRCVMVGDADSDEAAAGAADVPFVRVSAETGLRGALDSLLGRSTRQNS